MQLKMLQFLSVSLVFSANFRLALFLLATIPSIVSAQVMNQTTKECQYSLDGKDPLIFIGAEGYPPYGFIKNGTPVGANVDLIKELGKIINRPTDYRVYNWADAQTRFNNGEGHSLAIGAVTDNRTKLYDFTQSTFTFEFMLFVHVQRIEEFNNLDLSHKRVAYTRGSYPRVILENGYPEAEMIIVDNMAEGFRLLSEGKVDAAIEERLVGRYLLNELNLEEIKMRDGSLATNSAHILVRRGDTALLEELNRGISKLKSNGKLREISDRWLDGPFFITQGERQAALISVMITIAVIAVLAILLFISTIKRNRERKRLETQLQQSQRMEAVGQLTGGIAHDFNNLMAVMMGNLEAAMDKTQVNGALRDNLERTLGAVERGATLTQQLLSFSRQQTLSPTIVNANELIADTLKFLKRTLGENIQIDTKYSDEELLVNIDTAVFGNALVNMTLNSRDAMPDGGILTVRVTSIEPNGQQLGTSLEPVYNPHVLITVADTGAGIEKKFIEHIFEPFFTTKEVGKGSGLGLSMVYGFVSQSNGYINVKSTKGEGTTISLYLPIVDEMRDVNEDVAPFPNIHFNKTVLLVEDDEQVRNTCSLTLANLGCNVIEANDGPSAIDIIEERSEDIDLVFTDIVMPNNMSGLELAKKIAVDHKNINILLTSGYPDRVAEQNDLMVLGIELLAKPYTRAQLAAAIMKTSSGQIENQAAKMDRY